MSPVFLGVSLKMYFDHNRTLAWVQEISTRASDAAHAGVEVVVMPSFPSLEQVARIGASNGIKVGAQDMHWAPAGPFTGEVSGTSLTQVGCDYVLIGHAERRASFGDTDDVVAKKLAAGLRAHLTPVLCVGEVREVAPQDAADQCVRQLESATSALDYAARQRPLVVAYEPVWAIGKTDPAPLEHVRTVAYALRQWADHWWGGEARVAYGGSAGSGLFEDFGDAIDGLFLGRYAHEPQAFGKILDEALEFGAARPR